MILLMQVWGVTLLMLGGALWQLKMSLEEVSDGRWAMGATSRFGKISGSLHPLHIRLSFLHHVYLWRLGLKN